ncbi:glyoxylate reductase [Tepidicaulis marinus]|jgi:glyoxylate reductase|uniref:Glyoxylate reductase n=1 Tax=Tepidicaulis marinus TaxID=1333998 RepID=A0A081B713_9HYPH|nr:D-glycerate dehydrogenase [Tepidicaulis marinus]GAK43831.1 glyoxylate reductase [Tepidicaulis marinus]
MPQKPLVIVTRKLPEVIEARMGELFEARFNRTDIPMTEEELAAALAEADVLVPTVTDKLDAALLAKAGPKLKLIAQFGTGVDNIDVDAAVKRKITVTNTPSVLTEDTADMTMALILAVPRRLNEGARLLRNNRGQWPGWSPTWMLGHRIGGKKLGILGMGRIGQAVARRARAFGLEVHYHNRKPVNAVIEKELQATYWDSFDRMLREIDILSINCPHTPATFHLLNERRIAIMKPDSYVVNTARGEVVDQEALITALEEDRLGGAGLDVFEREPAIDPRLLKLENVVLLPHMSSATVEGRSEMGERVLINIRVWMDGEKPPDRVIPAIL